MGALVLAWLREAVFSSTGFRIRAAGGQAAGFRLAEWAEHAVASLFFTLFPADCRICGSPLIRVSRLPVCAPCLSALHALDGSFCAVCGEALVSTLFADHTDALCGLCQRSHPPFEKAVAYGSYDAGLRDLIHLLKFQQVRPAADVLGRMLGEAIVRMESVLPDGPFTVIPVPLHRKKLAQRGFNQSELIARGALKHISATARYKLLAGVLQRTRETESQIGLTRHQRRENLRGAFSISARDVVQVADREILLVDDVFTTGTTASECARVLRKAGARRVWVATVARTLKTSVATVLADEEINTADTAALGVGA